jgi:hypothetical protein
MNKKYKTKHKRTKHKRTKHKRTKHKRTKKYKQNGGNDSSCPICLQNLTELSEQNTELCQMIACDENDKCNHKICKQCFDQLPFKPPNNKKQCPLCRRDICSLKCGDTIHEVQTTNEAQNIDEEHNMFPLGDVFYDRRQ